MLPLPSLNEFATYHTLQNFHPQISKVFKDVTINSNPNLEMSDLVES